MRYETPPLERFTQLQADAAEVWMAQCPRCESILSQIIHRVDELPSTCNHPTGPPGLLLWVPEVAAVGDRPPPPHTPEERAQWLAAQ